MFYTKPKVIITISVRGQMSVMLASHITQVLEGLPGYIMVGEKKKKQTGQYWLGSPEIHIQWMTI